MMGVEDEVRRSVKWDWRFATLGEFAEAVEREANAK